MERLSRACIEYRVAYAMTEPLKNPCPDCGALVPDMDGPVHAYLGASPGCWHLYGLVLEREYSDAAYWRAHRYTVDAYAAQHPGGPDRRAVQSVNLHLAALYLLFETGASQQEATAALSRLAKTGKGRFQPLPKPDFADCLKVTDILAAEGAATHGDLAERWARDVWAAWATHHDAIAGLVADCLAV